MNSSKNLSLYIHMESLCKIDSSEIDMSINNNIFVFAVCKSLAHILSHLTLTVSLEETSSNQVV